MQKGDYPLVSIIIPVYNAERYLSGTLDSALNQTWPNKEIIIVNDGSKDKSLDIIKSYRSNEIILINQQNKGASAAKQTGLNKAAGAFIQYLDADDIIDIHKIERQVVALLDEPNKIAICKTAHFFNSEDFSKNYFPEDDHFFTDYLDEPVNFLIKLYGGFDLIGGMIQPNAFLTPKSIIEKAGPWNSNISPCMDEDGEYFSRVILHSCGIVYQSEVLNNYRKTTGNTSLAGLVSEVSCSNLIESIWLKHLHLLKHATTDYQLACIDNATYRCLEEIKIKVFLKFNHLVSKISRYQSKLSPSLRPSYQKLGGNGINFISKTFGWKLARRLQYIKELIHK